LLLLRHLCIAVGADEVYAAGHIEASLFSDHDVTVVIGTEKKGKPARNVILDVLPLEETGAVHQLRAAG
jgi:hypothetical protein